MPALTAFRDDETGHGTVIERNLIAAAGRVIDELPSKKRRRRKSQTRKRRAHRAKIVRRAKHAVRKTLPSQTWRSLG